MIIRGSIRLTKLHNSRKWNKSFKITLVLFQVALRRIYWAIEEVLSKFSNQKLFYKNYRPVCRDQGHYEYTLKSCLLWPFDRFIVVIDGSVGLIAPSVHSKYSSARVFLSCKTINQICFQGKIIRNDTIWYSDGICW